MKILTSVTTLHGAPKWFIIWWRESLSQAWLQELRILAQISDEEQFINAIKDGRDIHSYSASLLYGIPYENFLEYDQDGNIIMDGDEPKIKKEMKAKYRNPCKTITFG